MSTVQEIEAALHRLSRAEIVEIRVWIDDFLEDQLELTDAVKAKLDQSRSEIATGNYTTRQPQFQQVADAVGTTPFVVVPTDDLEESLVQLDAGARVEDGT